MTDIHLTGNEIGAPGSADHTQQCIIDGERISVIIQAVDGGQKPALSRALAATLNSNRCGIRRVVLETLRSTMNHG